MELKGHLLFENRFYRVDFTFGDGSSETSGTNETGDSVSTQNCYSNVLSAIYSNKGVTRKERQRDQLLAVTPLALDIVQGHKRLDTFAFEFLANFLFETRASLNGEPLFLARCRI
jgi:hypothetical protein